MGRSLHSLAALVIAGLTLSAFAQAPKPKPATVAAADSTPTAATTDPSYMIGAQDVLAINVWKEPEMSREVPVRPDGMITLPLINDVRAAGLTPLELTELLREKLKKYVEDPRVTVIVTAINSRKVYILGEVGHPGALPLLTNMTVLQALSSAGGFTQYANTGKIYVLRTENGKQQKLPFNYKEVIRGEKTEQNIVLRPGDTIVVP